MNENKGITLVPRYVHNLIEEAKKKKNRLVDVLEAYFKDGLKDYETGRQVNNWLNYAGDVETLCKAWEKGYVVDDTGKLDIRPENGLSIQFSSNTWLEKAKQLIRESTVPETLNVPSELGKWLDSQKHLFGKKSQITLLTSDFNTLRMNFKYDKRRVEDYQFMENNTIEIIEVLIGKREYKVEKVKRYYVQNGANEILLTKSNNQIYPSNVYLEQALSAGTLHLYQLTEKEIKDYDERYWSFAVEVAE